MVLLPEQSHPFSLSRLAVMYCVSVEQNLCDLLFVLRDKDVIALARIFGLSEVPQ